jgi:hypothetical protein
MWVRIAQSVQRLVTGRTVRGLNPSGARFLAPIQTGPRAHPASYNAYRVFARGKVVGALRWPPTPSSAKVEGRVELYIYVPCVPFFFFVCSRVNFTFT